ncbi:hypothetical protein L7F22_058562, partial [Adiantum nelumboides]|nr:hypothetical protein [Adiantum nelumboides]
IFHGWYYNIQSSSVFDKKELASKPSSSSIQRRTQEREERSSILRPKISKPSPRRRTMRTTWDRTRRVEECNSDEQALQWRASIYRNNLRAVPFILNSRVKVYQASPSDPENRARIERRLEPWIRRELEAITGNLDHSLLVHLVLSLWFRFLLEKEEACGGESAGQPFKRVPSAGLRDVDALQQLKPFLQEKASPFWHELRCFADSPYSLRAYDSLVKYEKYKGLCA